MTDAPVFKALDLPDARIVLLDWSNDKSYRYENLFCLNLDGSLKWKAHLRKTLVQMFLLVSD
jgi:hypothetical protein